MYKVQWNKKHTWKILKYYKEGKINKILFEGLWYRPVVNRNSFERDEFGNQYIACDGCDDCALVDVCHESNTDNPIGDACDEFGMSPCCMIYTTPPNKKGKLSMWVRRHIPKEEWDWWREDY